MESIQILAKVDAARPGRSRIAPVGVHRFLVRPASPGYRCTCDGAFQQASRPHAVLCRDGRARFSRRLHLDLLAGPEGRASLLSQEPGASAGQDSKVDSRISHGVRLSSRGGAVPGPIQAVRDRARSFPGALYDVCHRHPARTRFSVLHRSISGSTLRRASEALPCGPEMGFDRVGGWDCSSVLSGSAAPSDTQGRIFSDRLKFTYTAFQFTRDFLRVLVRGKMHRRANRSVHMPGPG